MPKNNPQRAGLNRSSLKPPPPRRRQASMPEPDAMPARAVALRLAPPPSPMRDALQVIGGVAVMLLIIVALLGTLHLIRDSMAVGKYLAEAKSQRSSLICQDGRMVRGDGSLRDILTADAYFVCTNWRTLQSIELEESKGR